MPELGQIIGAKYRLERLLGAGGMGSVYQASHVALGGKVAIKFLHPELSRDRESVGRFQREARAAAAIDHDAIVKVLDLGLDDDGAPYLVMELLRGCSLGRALADRGVFSVEETADLGCQLLAGLSAAHRAGIVHRDLKPDNVFLVDTGAALHGVKILDFGISRMTGLGTDSAQYERLTRTGVVMGTPSYMSPEHAAGRSDLDARSDLFSIGIILYECLTGKLPYDGPNYNAVLAAILTGDLTSPIMLRPDLPPALDELIQKALARRREERFQSAAELFDALVVFADETALGRIPQPVLPEPVETPPVRPSDAPTGPRPAGSPRQLDTPGPDDFDDAPTSLIAEPPAGQIDAAVTTIATPPAALSRLPILAAAVVVLVLGAAAGVAVWLPGEPGPEVAEPAGRDAGPPPLDASEAPATVSIELQGLPPGATVRVDGAIVTDLPLLHLTRDSTPRTLRVELAGHEPFQHTVVPLDDQHVAVELVPTPPPPARDAGAKLTPPPRGTGKRPQKTPRKYHGPDYFD